MNSNNIDDGDRIIDAQLGSNNDARNDVTPGEKTQVAALQAPGWMTFFFTRQTFAILLCIILLLGGMMGYFSMVKEGEPAIQLARARITTTWGGTDVQTIESQVTNKLEEQIKSLQGLDDLTSATFNSFSIINVAFSADAPIAESIQQLRSKVDDAESELPAESSGRDPIEPIWCLYRKAVSY
ncbi:MAG: efflux RND transporter permease subunit [Cyanobacteria bacterium J06627_28]